MEERLRPLTERECYARLYGERNPLVTVLPARSGTSPWPAVSADDVRRAFLERLDRREPGDEIDLEAA